MLLQDLFIPERIKINLEAEDKDEVFEELIDHLISSYGMDLRDEMLKVIRLREEKMSTGIKKGIALPHGKTSSVKGIIGAIGVSKKGIDYESLDGEPVYILFLIISSEDDTEQHLRVLKKIALLLEMPDFYNDLLKAESPEKLNRIIKKYEELLVEFKDS